MVVYVVQGAHGPSKIFWTRNEAEDYTLSMGGEIFATVMEDLSEAVGRYFDARGYANPDPMEAFLFLTSELGEMADAMVQAKDKEWVRNHPLEKTSTMLEEGGDVLMMLVKTMEGLGGDPIFEMLEKWRRKGWNV